MSPSPRPAVSVCAGWNPLFVPGQEKVTYVKMKPEMVPVVVEQHLVNHQVVTDYTIGAAE